MMQTATKAPRAAVPAHRAARVHGGGQMHRYSNLHLVLRKRILEGAYPVNAMLPGERELADEFAMARVTVRSALQSLEREGLVERQSRRGTVVIGTAPARARTTTPVDTFEGLFGSVMGVAQQTRVKVLEFGVVDASTEVAQALGIEPGAEVLCAVRVRIQPDIPISYSTVFVPGRFAAGIRRRDLVAKPLLTLLANQGVEVAHAEESVSASQADLEVAAALGVPVGAALLRVRRTIHDTSGQAVEFFHGLFRPERYEYRLVSDRDPSRTRISVLVHSS